MKKAIFIFLLAALGIALGGYGIWENLSTPDEPVGASSVFKTVTALNGVSMTATSSAIDIKGAKKVTLLLSTNIAGSGSTVFNVDGSIDGTTYLDYNKLVDNVANTNSQNLTRVSSKTYTGTSTGMLSFDLQNDTLDSFIITANLATTTGAISATAKALVEF